MRHVERLCGILAGVCGLVALLICVSQRTALVLSSSNPLGPFADGGTIVYGPTAGGTNGVPLLPLVLAVGGSVLTGVSALGDGRNATRRGVWLLFVVVGAVLTLVGYVLLGASRVAVVLGNPDPHSYGLAQFFGLLYVFFPAALFALLAALAALARRGTKPQ